MWLNYVACFFGGVFLTNAVPHFVNGVSGRAFQSPFAKPPGKGLSSSTANVVWGAINAVIGYLLLSRAARFDGGDDGQVAALGLGIFTFALYLARYFGRFHGGDLQDR